MPARRDRLTVPEVRYARSPSRSAGRRWLILATGLAMLACGGFAASATSQGQAIIAAVQRFLLFYAGVFALIALTAAVGAGLLATDRIVMPARGRVVSQTVHRVTSLTALAALIVHIALEILAHRSQLVDAVVPFVSRYRPLYMGLGTLASDLLIIIIATSLARRAFIGRGPAAWRAVHVTSYLMWLFAILHGLLAGRTAKPYVDWSYGACVVAVVLALLIRLVAQHRGSAEIAPGPVPASTRFAPAADIASALPRDIRRPLRGGGPEQRTGPALQGALRFRPPGADAGRYGNLPQGDWWQGRAARDGDIYGPGQQDWGGWRSDQGDGGEPW